MTLPRTIQSPKASRIDGLDLARALAIFGVIIVN